MGAIAARIDFWPLVITIARGACSIEQHVASLAEWQHWFARETPFAIVRLFADEAALIHPDGAARATKAWLRDGAADAIRRRVTAMVNVVPPSAFPRMAQMSIERTFGVPGIITADWGDALAWLRARGVVEEERLVCAGAIVGEAGWA